MLYNTVYDTVYAIVFSSAGSTGAQQLPQGEQYHYSAAARARSDAEVKRIRASASAEAARMRSSFEQASRVYSRLGGSAALHLAEEGSSAKRKMVALNAEAAKLTLEARNPHITAAVDSGVLVVTGWTLLSARLHWCLRAQQRVTQHLRAVAALAEITACCYAL
eukprot:19826-Heterococcus_DN1.PRE.1